MKTPIRTTLIAALCLSLGGAGCGQQDEKAAQPQPKEAPPPARTDAPPPPKAEPAPPERKTRGDRDPKVPRARRDDEALRRTPAPPFGQPTPYIGVVTAPVTPELSSQLGLDEGFGVLVEEIMPGSPAETAGLRRFDVITQLNDLRITNPEQLSQLVRDGKKGTEIILRLLRRGCEQSVKVAIGERVVPPFEAQSRWHRFGTWSNERSERPWLGERFRERTGDWPENLRETFERMERFQDEVQQQQERIQQQMREFQEIFRRHMHEYQERLREWQKDPQGQPAPEPPKPDDSSFRRDRGGPPRARASERQQVSVNVQVPGGGTAQIRSEGVVERADESGTYRLERNPDGTLTFSARARDGELQTWPVNTDEQRKAVPEAFRKKLLEMDNIKIEVDPARPAEPTRPKTRI